MTHCPFEDDVLAAVRRDEWSEELAEHRDSCLLCAEVTLVASVLNDDASWLAATEPALPNPRALWLRAKFDRRRTRKLRATGVITWMQRATIAAVAAVVLFFAPRLLSRFAEVGDRVMEEFSLPDVPTLIVAPSVVLVLTFAVLGLFALWSELAERSLD